MPPAERARAGGGAGHQNRVNPATLVRIPGDVTGLGEYWLSPGDADVRPYGFLIRPA